MVGISFGTGARQYFRWALTGKIFHAASFGAHTIAKITKGSLSVSLLLERSHFIHLAMKTRDTMAFCVWET
jgi:hypothetical protein